jgi:hypothetical protein
MLYHIQLEDRSVSTAGLPDERFKPGARGCPHQRRMWEAVRMTASTHVSITLGSVLIEGVRSPDATAFKSAAEGSCCTDQRNRRSVPPCRGLGDGDRLWASEVEHAVQSTIGDGHLGCLTAVRARAQAIADNPFEAADRRLSQRPAVIAGGFLPAHAPALTDPLQVPVALCRGSLSCQGRIVQMVTGALVLPKVTLTEPSPEMITTT